MDGRRPRGRRRRPRRASAQQSDEPPKDASLGQDHMIHSDTGTHSSGGTEKETVGDEDDNSILIRSKWETNPTPSIESSSPNEPFVITSSPLSSKLQLQDSVELYKFSGEQGNVLLETQQELTSEDQVTTNTDHSGEDRYPTPVHIMELSSFHDSEQESYDILDESGFMPIHLPLSSEIYTPAYCVHATDQCDMAKPGKSDLVPAESKSLAYENEMNNFAKAETQNELGPTVEVEGVGVIKGSESENPTEVIEIGLSVLPNLEKRETKDSVQVFSAATAPQLYVCTSNEEISVGKSGNTRKQNDAKVNGGDSPQSVSPTGSQEKKRWRPKFTWPKGNLKLARGTNEPSEVLVSKKRIHPANESQDSHLMHATVSPQSEALHSATTTGTSQGNKDKDSGEGEKKSIPLSCISGQKRANRKQVTEENTKIQKDNATENERRSKRGKRRKAPLEEKNNKLRNDEVREKKISLTMAVGTKIKEQQRSKHTEEQIFTDSEVEQLLTDVEISGMPSGKLEMDLQHEEEVRDATIKRKKDDNWLKTATIDAFRDIEEKLTIVDEDMEYKEKTNTKKDRKKQPLLRIPRKKQSNIKQLRVNKKSQINARIEDNTNTDVQIPVTRADTNAIPDDTLEASTKGRGFKFPWSPKIKVGKAKLGKGDLKADAKLDVSGPSIDLPSAQVTVPAPQVDVRVPDVSVGGDLSAHADVGAVPDVGLSGGLDLPEVSAPDLSGEVSLPGLPSSLDVDVGMPTLEVDATAPSVQVSVPQLKSPDVGADVGLGGVGELEAKANLDVPDVALKKPKFGFSFGKKSKKPKVVSPSVEVPGAGVDASVSLPAVETGVSGAVELPSAEVSVPAKKRGFGFGFGSKGKGAKKVAKPKVAADAGADVSLATDVRLPDVRVDVAADADGTAKAGAKGRGFKFPWSPKIKVGKAKLGKGDLKADAKLDVSGPSIDLPSAEAHLPNVYNPGLAISVPGEYVGSDFAVFEPEHEVAPGVHLNSANRLSGNGSVAHGPVDENLFSSEDVDLLFSEVCLVDSISVPSDGSVKEVVESIDGFVHSDSSKFRVSVPVSLAEAFSDVVALPVIDNYSGSTLPPTNTGVLYKIDSPSESGFTGDLLSEQSIRSGQNGTSPESHVITYGIPDGFESVGIQSISSDANNHPSNLTLIPDSTKTSPGRPDKFWSLRIPARHKRTHAGSQLKKQKQREPSPTFDEYDLAEKSGADKIFDGASDQLQPLQFTINSDELSDQDLSDKKHRNVNRERLHFNLPRVFGSLGRRKHKSHIDAECKDEDLDHIEIKSGALMESVPVTEMRQKPKKSSSRAKKKTKKQNELVNGEVDKSDEAPPTPRTPSGKPKDLFARQTWHGDDEFRRASQEENYAFEFCNPPQLPPEPTSFRITPVLRDPGNIMGVRRRSTIDSVKRRPWSTVGLPPPGCKCINDDYLFPDALTPTKIPSFRGSRDVVYNVPYMDDQALPVDEPEWPIGESRRTLLSQLSQTSDGVVRIAAEEESSIISLDDKENRFTDHQEKSFLLGRLFGRKSRPKSKQLDPDKSHDPSTSHTKHSSKLAIKLNRTAHDER